MRNLKCMVNEHVFMNLISLSKKISPCWLWDLACLGICTTRIDRDNHCSEGDTKFFSAVKIVQPKDLGFREPKASKCWKWLNASSLHIMSVIRCLRSEWVAPVEKKRRSFFELSRTNFALYKHIRPCTKFLEMCGKWARGHGFSITQ